MLKNIQTTPPTFRLTSTPLPVRLCPREQQVTQHLLSGKTSKEMAMTLGITSRTIETYMDHLKNKRVYFIKVKLPKKASNALIAIIIRKKHAVHYF